MTIAYLVTNNATGRKYIGITRQKLEKRWRAHVQLAKKGASTALARSIRKHGEFAFTVEPIATCLDQEWSGQVESALIKQHKSKAPLGYNLTDGGDGVHGLPQDIRERIAAKNRGKKLSLSPEARLRRIHRGRKVSPEVRAAISAKHRGKKLSEEHRKKLSLAKLGKKLKPRSREHSARISEGLTRAWKRRRSA